MVKIIIAYKKVNKRLKFKRNFRKIVAFQDKILIK